VSTSSGPAVDECRPPAPERRSYRDALARTKAAQKSSKGAPAYSRYVNRAAGRRLAALAYKLGLSPSQVTAISGTFSMFAIACLAVLRPSFAVGLLVTASLLFGYALDSADGQLARLTGTSSLAGEWLDHMIDATKIASMHLAVLISVFRFDHLSSNAYLLVPLGFSIVTSVLFFGMVLNDLFRRVTAARSGRPTDAPPAPSRLRSIAVAPTDFGVVCGVFLLLALASVKWFRDMKALA
jgi:phosphatidylglycerophosphate synthase